MRVLGLDLGSRRIGVALSDATGTLASPLPVLPRGRRVADDHAAIAGLVSEYEVDRVVVGLPLSLDGGKGPAARSVEAEVAELTRALPVAVEAQDERFSTVSATRSLVERGVRARERRSTVDSVAASVLLQSWLDGARRLHAQEEGG